MHIWVIYDTRYGHTERIAQVISAGLSPQAEMLRTTDAKPEQWAVGDLLVIGTPTQGGQPSSATTELLAGVTTQGLNGIRVAAFDTRVAIGDVKPLLRPLARLFGFAAPRLAQRLREKGGDLIVEPEGFCVLGTEGPLKEGELTHAAGWAQKILAAL